MPYHRFQQLQMAVRRRRVWFALCKPSREFYHQSTCRLYLASLGAADVIDVDLIRFQATWQMPTKVESKTKSTKNDEIFVAAGNNILQTLLTLFLAELDYDHKWEFVYDFKFNNRTAIAYNILMKLSTDRKWSGVFCILECLYEVI